MAAIITASVVGVVGVSAISPQTAQAAGVVVQQRTYGVGDAGVAPRDDD